MFPPLLILFILCNTIHLSTCHSHSPPPPPPLHCNETCGELSIPFPFFLSNSSCSASPSTAAAFRLTCSNSTALFLTINADRYRVLQFFPEGVLVDFPASTCRQYYNLNAFPFAGNRYFGISEENVVGLYDCDDSSLCKPGCETIDYPGCDGDSNGSPACCYPLSDRSSWDLGDGFSVFSNFGCRGFTCWVVPRGAGVGKRGVKLEWALLGNSSNRLCASDADTVNATTVQGGLRCVCRDGFVGDGYAGGGGCLKTCVKDGREARGGDCLTRRRSRKMVSILAGILGPIFVVATLTALFCLLKRRTNGGTYEPNKNKLQNTLSFRKPWTTRSFTYRELEEATNCFDDGQKLTDATSSGAIYAGLLADGSPVAVHKVECRNQQDLSQVLSRIEVLSAVFHRNMARIIGCCIDCGYTPLVVYEFPGNGTVEEHLRRREAGGLDWYQRLSIAAETASVLAFLQQEVSPPIFHHNLRSGCLFLDDCHSVRVAGFRLHIGSDIGGGIVHRSDVYEFGLLLLEMVAGTKSRELPAAAMQRSGKVEEIVDPNLYYHEQTAFRREQIEAVADLATRCWLFGREGKIGIAEVAKELVHIAKESGDGGSRRGPALEETFSNSSLLQMISMSPDSIYVH
ncbi:unnamed protein product [Linum trigynum]|uniref:Protein kinase domain-containing protein n=1 Tax=Linum trigynum TaxID=586398 RepID=A0AAV2F1K6_9ROSI